MRSSLTLAATTLVFLGGATLPVSRAAETSQAPAGAVAKDWVDCSPSILSELEQSLPINPLEDFHRIVTAISQEGFPFQLKLEVVPRDDAASPFAHLKAGFRETASEITVADKQITLRSETIVGLSGGIYKLLEAWGCRWVLPGGLGEVLPKPAKLTLENGTRLITLGSDVAFGGSSAKGEFGIWNQRNRTYPASGLPCTHYWLKGVEPATYLKSHPEYYALVDGERTPTQPETVNPEVVRLKIENAKAYFRNYPSARSYPMDPEDNTFFSEAPEATRLDPEGTGADGLPYMTDRVIHFSNAVREGFKDEFPDKLVGFYSYLNHSLPPVNQKVDPHTAVGVTRFGYCTFRLLPTPATSSPADFEELVRQWLTHTEHVYVYDYNPPPWAGALPFPTWQTMAEGMQRLSGMGVKGFYSDVPYGASFAPGVFVNTYLRRRMMVAPGQDPAQLMEEYCRGFFDNAGDLMRQYYATLESATQAPLPGRHAVGVSIYGYEELFPRATVARASALLDQALALKLEPKIKERINLVALGHHYLVAFLNAVDASKSGDLEAAEKHFQEIFRNLVRQERSMGELANFDDAKRRMKALQATLYATYFPGTRGAFTRWELTDLLPRRQIPVDQEPEVFTATGRYAWKLYSLKSSIIDFNELLRGNKKSQPLSKAFARCTVTLPESREVTLLYGAFFPGRLYVNGEKIIDTRGPAFFNPDMTRRKVTLKQGVNTFWVVSDEVVRSSADNPMSDGIQWSFTLAMQDHQGRPVPFQTP